MVEARKGSILWLARSTTDRLVFGIARDVMKARADSAPSVPKSLSRGPFLLMYLNGYCYMTPQGLCVSSWAPQANIRRPAIEILGQYSLP